MRPNRPHSSPRNKSQSLVFALCLLVVLSLTGCTALGGSAPQVTPTPPATATPTVTPTATATPTTTPTPTMAPTSTPSPTPLPPTPTPVTGPLAQFIVSGEPATGVIALTFDLGVPGAGATPQVLDILREEQVSVTFFPTGLWAENNPEIIQRIIAEGHQLGNHSYDHPDFTTVPDATVLGQMEQTESIIQKITGQSSKPYMRPPFGAYDKRVLGLMDQLGYAVVYWTLDSTDWREESTVDSVVSVVLEKAKPGDIVVMHGHAPKTAAALPAIVKGLKAKGHKLGTVSDVLGR